MPRSLMPFLRSALFLLAAALWFSAAQAQERATRNALIVGVSRYASTDVEPLAGVPFDIDSAQAIARGLGIPASRTTVLRDAQASKQGVLEALDRLAAEAAPGGRTFIYFSGHGTRWHDPAVGGCKEGLLAHDRQPITNEEIAQRTRRISEVADKLLVFFDACHSDGLSGSRIKSRSAAAYGLTPKFFLKGGEDAGACAQLSNVKTRGLLAESQRLGALSENFVQISSSRADEASFDEPGKGGLATQAVRDCLLGRASDLDASGAVSMQEVQQCAQSTVDNKLSRFPDNVRQHLNVMGNRNIVPVSNAVLATVAPVLAAPLVVTMPPPGLPMALPATTLREILAQRNPRREVSVQLSRDQLRIGRDPLELTVRSSHDGHVYLVLAGSDQRSFYLLFPNGLDQGNRIQAGQPLVLPRPSWRLLAQGPAGTDHLLVLVTDTPRDLRQVSLSSPSTSSPFTVAANDLAGRTSLLEFFAGRGVTGGSENFGAALVAVQEVP
jgi:Caspase domain/Domain of unknown function (DUF4384)